MRGSDSNASNTNFGFADAVGGMSETDEKEESNAKGLYGGDTLSIQSGKALVGIDTLKEKKI